MAKYLAPAVIESSVLKLHCFTHSAASFGFVCLSNGCLTRPLTFF